MAVTVTLRPEVERSTSEVLSPNGALVAQVAPQRTAHARLVVVRKIPAMLAVPGRGVRVLAGVYLIRAAGHLFVVAK